jgi:hypothetical protein
VQFDFCCCCYHATWGLRVLRDPEHSGTGEQRAKPYEYYPTDDLKPSAKGFSPVDLAKYGHTGDCIVEQQEPGNQTPSEMFSQKQINYNKSIRPSHKSTTMKIAVFTILLALVAAALVTGDNDHSHVRLTCTSLLKL